MDVARPKASIKFFRTDHFLKIWTDTLPLFEAVIEFLTALVTQLVRLFRDHLHRLAMIKRL